MPQAIAQQRAKHALEKIREYENESAKKQKKFSSYVSSFGPMILMNGFGQACAFYLANKKSEHQDVLKLLDDWLTEEGRPLSGQRNKSHIVDRIVDINAHEYQLAQVEALAYLDWLKKFAKAFLKSDADDTEEEEDAAAA